MKKLHIIVAISVSVGVLTLNGVAGGASATGPPTEVRPQYLALGDSLAVGVGASDPATTGYVPRFHGHLADALDPGHANPPPLDFVPDAFNRKFLRLTNLAVGGPGAPPGGETTSSMIAVGQLDAAIAELVARNGNATPVDDVRVVTLDIGGNDMFSVVPVCVSGPTPECANAIGTALATFSANFDFILDELRAAAGPDTTIIVMTYYNPLVNPGCPLSPHAALGDALLEGNPALGIPDGVNDLIRAMAASHGAGVADVFGLLGPSDVQPDCRHANDSGYQVIAEEFKSVGAGGSASPVAFANGVASRADGISPVDGPPRGGDR
jgi:lysophospholipase L1-like esterase